MRRSLVAVVVALLAWAVLSGAIVGTGAEGVDDAVQGGSPPDVGTPSGFDRARFVITVYENGSAEWNFQYIKYLSGNETKRAQFETYADRFESQETDLYRNFRDRATALASFGRNRTGREMSATSFSRAAYVREGINDVGVVEMSFRWTDFALTTGSNVVVGDVFEGGLYVAASQSLVVKRGPGLAFSDVAPNGTTSGDRLETSESVTWQGEREFTDGHPRVVFVTRSEETGDGGDGTAGTTDGTSDTSTVTATTPGGTPDEGGQSWMMYGLVVVLLAGTVGAVVYLRNNGGTALPGGSEAAGGAEGSAVPRDAAARADVDGIEPAPAPEPAVTDEELLSDEDRVVKLLEENGGRMRQVNIVDETGWSKSKVSMLLSDMEAEDTISKLRVGRENIISLEGQEPEAARSPFEDVDDEE